MFFILFLSLTFVWNTEYFPSSPYIEYYNILNIPYILNLENVTNGLQLQTGDTFPCSDRIANTSMLGIGASCSWVISTNTNFTNSIRISLNNNSILINDQRQHTFFFFLTTSNSLVPLTVDGTCPLYYLGPSCTQTTCQGLSSTNASVCHWGRGICTTHDLCTCTGNFAGSNCDEEILEAYYSAVKEIQVKYEVEKDVLSTFGLDQVNALFHCKLILKDYGQFGANSRCRMKLSNENLKSVQSLEIVNPPQNIEQVTIKPLTGGPEKTVNIKQYEGSTDLGRDIQAIIIVATGLVYISCMCCCCLACCCCICCCFGNILPCLCCCWRRYNKRLKRIKKIPDLDEILKEKDFAIKDGSVAAITIKKSTFKIVYDDLKILSTIGTGGSECVVFKCKWKGKVAAFKCFKTQDICRNQFKFEEFEREIEILGSVNHPYILRFYGAALKPPRVGILLEYCKEGDLKHFFKSDDGKEFSLPERLRVLRECAAAMQYLHSINIIHRDLKCENVLLDRIFSVRVMDFGLARIVKSIQEQKTVRIGTSNYMAPEVVLGKNYDEKCDVFSFAIAMWEVLSGNFNPYKNIVKDSDYQIEFKVASDPNLRPPLNLPPFSDNPWLVVLVTETWSHDPLTRPSFEEIHDTFVREKNIRKKQQKEDDDVNGRSNSGSFIHDLKTPRMKRRSKSVFVGHSRRTRLTKAKLRQLTSINEGKIKELKKRYNLLSDRMIEFNTVKLENEELRKEVRTMSGEGFNLWMKMKNRMSGAGKRGSLMWKLDQLNLLNEHTNTVRNSLSPTPNQTSDLQEKIFEHEKGVSGLASPLAIAIAKKKAAEEEKDGKMKNPMLRRTQSGFAGMFRKRRMLSLGKRFQVQSLGNKRWSSSSNRSNETTTPTSPLNLRDSIFGGNSNSPEDEKDEEAKIDDITIEIKDEEDVVFENPTPNEEEEGEDDYNNVD